MKTIETTVTFADIRALLCGGEVKTRKQGTLLRFRLFDSERDPLRPEKERGPVYVTRGSRLAERHQRRLRA
jgi:hypothetical protein